MSELHDPSDEQTDEVIAWTWARARAALVHHPQRARAVKMVEQGGGLCMRHVGGPRYQLFIGWLADPGMRGPRDVDPHEVIPLATLPRSAVLGGLDGLGETE